MKCASTAAIRLSHWTLALVFLLAAAHRAEAQPVKARAVYPSVDIQYLPAYVALAKGYYKDEGLDVELIVMRGARTGVQAVLSGDAHFVMALGAAVSAIWSGADLKIVAQMMNRQPFSLIVRPEIQKVADLRGKKIGASVGSTTFALVHEYLKQNGVDPDKGVEYVNISGAGPRIAALEKGLIAAGPLAPPTDVKAVQAGLKRLVYFGDILPEMAVTGLVTSTRLTKENPATVEKMVRAIVRATKSSHDDPAAALAAMQGYMKMPPEDARESYRLVRASFNPALTEDGVRKMAALVSSATGVSPTKDPKEYIDQSFLNRVLLPMARK
jgi:ABC-type nitrate/sulfonate/bicarbonate transport system substrate-binding protein